jgi:uncharacterized membrane protein
VLGGVNLTFGENVEIVKNTFWEIKLYFVTNWLVNIIAGIAVAIIVLFQITGGMPVPNFLNTEVVNYYFDILVPNSTAKCDTRQYQAANAISLNTIAGCLKPKHFLGR